MRLIFITHPTFQGSQSMPRFTAMLAKGMKEFGHDVEVWAAKPYFIKLPFPFRFKKWLGYIDQYVLFSRFIRGKVAKEDKETLYVVTDHALGPYVPFLAHKAHVVHCHDFLAQRSALSEIPENITSATGKIYQNYIKTGYQKGKNFISVSEKTRDDLKLFLGYDPEISAMVYNGLNPVFKPMDKAGCRARLGKEIGIDLSEGYLLHIGGNQWYKNRIGVLQIYNKWRSMYAQPLPLIMIGEKPSDSLRNEYEISDFKSNIYFLSGKNDDIVHQAYAGASVFLFPSIAEGFGWPIAEAMACGTIVVTTNEAPMSEVAGTSSFSIDRKPSKPGELVQWQEKSAVVLHNALNLDIDERAEWINRGMVNIRRFNLDDSLRKIEEIYKKVLDNYTN